MCNNGQKLIEEGHEDMAQFKDLIEDLMDKWRQLKDAVDHRRNQLNQSEKAQQVSPLLFVLILIFLSYYLKFWNHLMLKAQSVTGIFAILSPIFGEIKDQKYQPSLVW